MEKEIILLSVKSKLGISTEVRDTFLLDLIISNLDELTSVYGIAFKDDSTADIDFIADWVVERYAGKEEMSIMLKSRFNNYLLTRRKKHVEQ